MIKVIAAAALLAAVPVLTACGGPAQTGTVRSYTYKPPGVQTVATSCSWWSSGGSSKYGSSGSGYCLDENTAQEPDPQDCELTLSSGARVRLDVTEAQCKAYLGRHWPLSGGAS